MAGADAAAWAQAYLSAAAILISGALAVFVPWNERRLTRKREDDARLSVASSRSDIGGLRLRIKYTPEFQSHAVGAMVKVIEPAGAHVFQGVVEGNTSNGDHSDRVVPGNLATPRTFNAVSLLPEFGGALAGIMFIEFADQRLGPTNALIEVSLLRHGNYLFYKRKMRVSQSDASYYANGAPVAVITGSGD